MGEAKKSIDMEAIERCVRDIIVALNDDPEREGLIETPHRVAKMFAEVFEGQLYTNGEIADMFDKCFTSDSDGMVVERHIPVFSHCEHHMALMYNMSVSIAYIPNGKVIGLSKMARVADMVCKRLQLQERITQDIWDVMNMILETEDIAVFVSGEHSCMTARGIKKPGVKTRTNVLGGRFKNNPQLRAEVISMLGDD